MNRHLEEALLILKDAHRKLASDEGGLKTLAEDWLKHKRLRENNGQCNQLLNDAIALYTKEVDYRRRHPADSHRIRIPNPLDTFRREGSLRGEPEPRPNGAAQYKSKCRR